MMRLLSATGAAALMWIGASLLPAQAATCGSVTATFCNSDAAIFLKGTDTFPEGLVEQNIFTTKLDEPSTNNTGNVGSQAGLPIVHFDTDVAVSTGNGFAQIGAGNDSFKSLTFSIPGYTFNDLIFNTQGLLGGRANNDVTITAFLAAAQIITGTLTGLGAGETGWLTLALNGGVFDKVIISSISGFKKIDQFQVSGLTAVPIPPAIICFGTALAGLALLKRKTRNSSRAQYAHA